ncbi:MAG TPA: tetratricopeptide repeat protein [Kofleriaceae bacterium]|nr:tetratricopeptide repeat protein [Kofleriaceae bacterium]
MIGGCPSPIELSRALAMGAEPELTAHIAGCPTCSTAWTEHVEAIDLARELPLDLPAAARRDEVRTAILAAAPVPPRVMRRARWIAPALATAALLALILVGAHHRAPAPTPSSMPATRGHLHPHADARVVEVAGSPDEIVRVREGTVDIDVDPLLLGERFRVLVGADVIEVHGTSFQVAASADRLVGVHVAHGRVEVRRLGVSPVFLTAGQTWHEPEVAASAPQPPPSAIEVPVPPLHRPLSEVPLRPTRPMPTPSAPAPAPAAPPPSLGELGETAFVSGWEAMRRKEFRQAAAAFARVRSLAPDGSLAEDASFWYAVALARQHLTAEAIPALREFLASYRASARAGAAATMLGWLLIEAHEPKEALQQFNSALGDPSASVRASARAGIAALHAPDGR